MSTGYFCLLESSLKKSQILFLKKTVNKTLKKRKKK